MAGRKPTISPVLMSTFNWWVELGLCGWDIVFINYCRVELGIFAFSIISQHWHGADCWNLSPLKTETHVSCTISSMAVDGPTSQHPFIILTHQGRMTHICVCKLGHRWSRSWLAAYLAPNHYLNQCSHVANWTLESNFHWKLNRDTTIVITENQF